MKAEDILNFIIFILISIVFFVIPLINKMRKIKKGVDNDKHYTEEEQEEYNFMTDKIIDVFDKEKDVYKSKETSIKQEERQIDKKRPLLKPMKTTLNLGNIEDNKDDIAKQNKSIKRLEKLSVLKRAILWSEILGTPKGM